MTVLSLRGNPLNWAEIARMPEVNRVKMQVMWSERDQSGDIIHDCLFSIAQLDWMNAKAIKDFGAPMDVIQPMNNKGVEMSKGTHDHGFCRDYWIKGLVRTESQGLVIQHWARFQCGCADWLRTPAQGFTYHVHGFPLPPGGHLFPVAVGEYVDGGVSQKGWAFTSSQIDDYWRNTYGLKGQHNSGADPTPFPTVAQKKAGIFDLDRYITNQLEETMEYKDWSPDSKRQFLDDIAQRLLDVETVVLKKGPGPADNEKIPIRNVLQRQVNGD